MPIQWLLMAAFLVAAALCFRTNQKYRGEVDAALAAGERMPMRVPERLPSYDAAYIDAFRAKAAGVTTQAGGSALEIYLRPVLLWLDVGFAVFLSLAAALFWSLLPDVATSMPCIGGISKFCAVMSVAYGVADVAEDLWLARLLGRTSATARLEGIIACTLTRLKFATITLSLVGGLAFWVFSKIFGRPPASG
jgi:hypothetical protein